MTLEIVRGHPKVPIGGWHFNCHGQVFQGKNADDVIARLTEYRTLNSLPLGNPEAEIADHLASISPWLVRESHAQTIASNGKRQIVAEHTMATWYYKPTRLPVHSPIVEERLNACAICPLSEFKFSDPETSYWHDAVTKASLMTGDMGVAHKGWCKHHHWLVALACRLVSPDKLATMPSPECCWQKST